MISFFMTKVENALFLVSNNLGQLSAESPTTSRVIADGLSIPSAFEFSYAEQLVIYIGDQQVKHNDYISVIRVSSPILFVICIGNELYQSSNVQFICGKSWKHQCYSSRLVQHDDLLV